MSSESARWYLGANDWSCATTCSNEALTCVNLPSVEASKASVSQFELVRKLYLDPLKLEFLQVEQYTGGSAATPMASSLGFTLYIRAQSELTFSQTPTCSSLPPFGTKRLCCCAISVGAQCPSIGYKAPLEGPSTSTWYSLLLIAQPGPKAFDYYCFRKDLTDWAFKLNGAAEGVMTYDDSFDDGVVSLEPHVLPLEDSINALIDDCKVFGCRVRELRFGVKTCELYCHMNVDGITELSSDQEKLDSLTRRIVEPDFSVSPATPGCVELHSQTLKRGHAECYSSAAETGRFEIFDSKPPYVGYLSTPEEAALCFVSLGEGSFPVWKRCVGKSGFECTGSASASAVVRATGTLCLVAFVVAAVWTMDFAWVRGPYNLQKAHKWRRRPRKYVELKAICVLCVAAIAFGSAALANNSKVMTVDGVAATKLPKSFGYVASVRMISIVCTSLAGSLGALVFGLSYYDAYGLSAKSKKVQERNNRFMVVDPQLNMAPDGQVAEAVDIPAGWTSVMNIPSAAVATDDVDVDDGDENPLFVASEVHAGED